MVLAYYGGMYRGFYYDSTYILVLIGAVICLLASAKVNNTFNRYSRVRSMSGLTGREAAIRMLNNAGIYDVAVTNCRGQLTDHYDPRRRTVYLSEPVYNSTSVAAIGVACHECGHAIQHKENYTPLTVRSSLVNVANIGSTLSWPIIIAGVIFGGMGANSAIGYMLIQVGIIAFSLAVLFQLVTLPVEFNASNRALRAIAGNGIFTDEELKGARNVLMAAALTYVASAVSAILQLLRLILLFGGRRRD